MSETQRLRHCELNPDAVSKSQDVRIVFGIEGRHFSSQEALCYSLCIRNIE